MKRTMKKNLLCLPLGILFFLCHTALISNASEYGRDAKQYMEYLSESYPNRVQNTTQGRAAGKWIKKTLESFGYTVEKDYHEAFGMQVNNYIATKSGKSEHIIYVGSHYDCGTENTKGAYDNASGVGVNLELAKYFANQDTDYTIRFCFWDAEELDYALAGSYLYTEQLTREDWDKIVLYINLDSVAAGDHLFAYGGQYVDGRLTNDWALNMADTIATCLDIDLRHIPREVTLFQTPTRMGSSDHHYFAVRGNIPYVYFESTAWIREDYSVNQEHPGWINSNLPYFSDTDGQIMHSKYDNMEDIEAAAPGRVEEQLSDVFNLSVALIQKVSNAAIEKYSMEHTLKTPTIFVDKGTESVTISWQPFKGTMGGGGYCIYRWENAKWNRIAIIPAHEVDSYIDTNIEIGKSYDYMVKAYFGTPRNLTNLDMEFAMPIEVKNNH